MARQTEGRREETKDKWENKEREWKSNGIRQSWEERDGTEPRKQIGCKTRGGRKIQRITERGREQKKNNTERKTELGKKTM